MAKSILPLFRKDWTPSSRPSAATTYVCNTLAVDINICTDLSRSDQDIISAALQGAASMTPLTITLSVSDSGIKLTGSLPARRLGERRRRASHVLSDLVPTPFTNPIDRRASPPYTVP